MDVCMSVCAESGGDRRFRLGGNGGGQGFELGGQWRARSASLYGGLGACPQWGPGAKPLVRGSQGGEAPLKPTRFLRQKVRFWANSNAYFGSSSKLSTKFYTHTGS